MLLLSVLAALSVHASGDINTSSTGQHWESGQEMADEAQMAMMVRARTMPESTEETYSEPEPWRSSIPKKHATRRNLSAAEIEEFRREGYVVVRGFYEADELDFVRGCLRSDPLIFGEQGKNMSVNDASGKETRLTLWWRLGDDTFSRLGRETGLVTAASALMDGAEPYHSHLKVLLKEPRVGGAWEWYVESRAHVVYPDIGEVHHDGGRLSHRHQDFGYWYSQGLSQPDGIVSAIIAVDENSRANGAMRVLSRSHRLGRLEHGVYGQQSGADPQRVLHAMGLPGHQVRSLLLRPGDVAFTHSNLLHCSLPNLSPHWWTARTFHEYSSACLPFGDAY